MKKLLLPAAIIIALVVGVAFYLFAGQKTAEPIGSTPTLTPTPTLFPLSLFGDVVPGTTSEQGVVTAVGPPLRVDSAGGTKTYIYKSGVGNKAVDVDIGTGGVVTRVITPIAPGVHLNSFLRGLGADDLELYGTFERLGFRLYVYLQRGIAVLGNPTTQEASEYWTFQPTDASTFQTTIATGYAPTFDENKQ